MGQKYALWGFVDCAIIARGIMAPVYCIGDQLFFQKLSREKNPDDQKIIAFVAVDRNNFRHDIFTPRDVGLPAVEKEIGDLSIFIFRKRDQVYYGTYKEMKAMDHQ